MNSMLVSTCIRRRCYSLLLLALMKILCMNNTRVCSADCVAYFMLLGCIRAFTLSAGGAFPFSLLQRNLIALVETWYAPERDCIATAHCYVPDAASDPIKRDEYASGGETLPVFFASSLLLNFV